MSEIMVSICCLVYNHEKYLRKCLDGFVNQKTDFKYEVLLHDDASTDSSAEIIREYEKKYPELIKPIYQTENQHSKGVRISYIYQYPRAAGKYIAMCEGDDYWCDEYKLQKQVDMMEAHPECSLCTHRVQFIQADGTLHHDSLPRRELPSGILPGKTLMEWLLRGEAPFHTSSFFYKSAFSFYKNPPDFLIKAPVGDLPRLLQLAHEGDVAYIDEAMSCYRMNASGNWTGRFVKDSAFRQSVITRLVEMYRNFDRYTDEKYHEQVEYAIARKVFEGDVKEINIKRICAKENKGFFKELCLKERVAYTAVRCLPFLKEPLRRYRDRRY